MPPAFNLSQDQTLQFNTCTRLHSSDVDQAFRFYASSFVTSQAALSATRPASFSMSTSRDAYRAPKDQPTSAARVSSSCTSSPVTQGRHHPKYPHLSVVHVVKERARPGSSNNAGFGRAEGSNYNDSSS